MANSDYLITPIPENEELRQQAVKAAMCSFVPKEERFDRITRMAQRMLHVPIALISIVDDDVQWFRSAQGLAAPQTPRSISFCGHAIVTDKVLHVPDAHKDPRFAKNPLVTGPPHIRAYLGWPLELAPGLRAGTLCVIDRMPRTFTSEDVEIMADLAHMAESELRINMLADRQKRLLMESSRSQRQYLLDAETGTWSERGFMELMRRTMVDVQAGQAHAALVAVRILNYEDIGPGKDEAERHARAIIISELLRQRLPDNAVICRRPGGYAAVLLASTDESALDEQFDKFQSNPDEQVVPGVVVKRQLHLVNYGMRLRKHFSSDEAPQYFEQVFKLLEQ